jgi:hypothetical protein
LSVVAFEKVPFPFPLKMSTESVFLSHGNSDIKVAIAIEITGTSHYGSANIIVA